jgi:predicted transcriptional regulator
MLKDEVVELDELAEALGRSERWLKENWLRLAGEGFPRKHPTGWTWPRRAVTAWLRAQDTAAFVPVTANDNAGMLEWPLDADQAYMAELEAAYGVAQ